MQLKWIIIFIVFLLVCNIYIPEVFGFEVKTTHPRLVDIGKISKNNKTIDLLKREADYYMSSKSAELVKKKYNERKFIRLYSLLSELTGKEIYFKKAQQLIESLLNAPESKDDQQIRTRLQAYAYYYDLCFNILTDSEKERIQTKILWHIGWLDQHKYLRTSNFGGGHHHYANISTIIGGLAIYHEVPSVQKTVQALKINLTEGFQPFYKYLAEEDGGFHMWWGYSRYYIFDELEFCTIWRNATGENIFIKNQWLKNTAYFLIYGLRSDMTYWGTGDNSARYPGWIDRMLLKKIAGEYNNGNAKYLAERLKRQRKDWPGIDELFFNLLWKNDSIEPKSNENFPLVKEFKRVGTYVFREGWRGDNVSALFKNTPVYFGNHSHRDANSFAIWYKEDLAIDSGYYDEYGSEHWWNYYIRSIAHNTVLIYNPDEKFELWGKEYINDGGQRFIQEPHSQPYNVEDLKSEAFKVGETTLLENNDSYSYVVGDATDAYSSDKCELFKRHFIWFKNIKNWNHPIIVIFDEIVSTKPEFEKTWLLHSINRPKIEKNLITIKNGKGKLWNYVIEPRDFNIEVIGGEGHEFDVNGINYVPETDNLEDVQKWAGAWRVELKEKIQQKETHFLNVLIPTEESTKVPPKVEAVQNGVRVEDWEIKFDGSKLNIVQVKENE